MSEKPYQLGDDARKIDPMLRMIANGATSVNVVRAESCASLAVAPSVKIEPTLQTSAVAFKGFESAVTAPPRGNIEEPPTEILVNVFISTDSQQKLSAELAAVTNRVGSLATATVPLSELKAIAGMEHVRSITAGQQLKDPDPLVSPRSVAAPSATLRQIDRADLHRDGEHVLVGIIDVQGFDFAHPDFLGDNGQTRFEAIWDQGAERDATSPRDYGRVIDKARMDEAIAAARRGSVRPRPSSSPRVSACPSPTAPT